MANKVIYDGTPGPISGSTPFGFYDSDIIFQTDGPKVANFCARKLGYPIMEVELQDQNFYTCFEEAVTTYGNEIYLFKIRDNFLNLEGSSTGSAASGSTPAYNLNNTVVVPNLTNVINLSEAYGEVITVGGSLPLHSGSLGLTTGIQTYDLKQWASSSLGLGDEKIVIKRIFYESMPASVRSISPFGTIGQTALAETWGMQGATAVTNMIYPVYWDIQKIQETEMSDYVRRSHFTFEIVNNVIKIFPIPNLGTESINDNKLWIEYQKVSEMSDINRGIYEDKTNLITNISNVPYANPLYSQINTPGKYWIYSYTSALAKEMLAYVRGKYATVPIPGEQVALNQSDLLTDARSEKKELIEKLRLELEESLRKNQLERKQAEKTALKETLNEIPLFVYIGSLMPLFIFLNFI